MSAKTIDLDEAWEDGSLGRDADHVAVADESFAKLVDEAIDLQPISIRLPKSLIEQLKLIARCHGIGYQPLVRDVLMRFARVELRDLLHQMEQAQRAEATLRDADSPAAKFFEPQKRAAVG